MFKRIAFIISILLVLTHSVYIQAALCNELSSEKNVIPLRDFFRNPLHADFAISPNGKTISYLAPWHDRLNIYIQPTSVGTPVRLTEIKDRDIHDYFWKGNDTIYFLRDFNGDENFQLYSVNIKTNKISEITHLKGVRTEIIDDLEGVDDNHILISLNQRDKKIFDVYKLDVTTGKMQLIAKNPGDISSWMTDHKGHLRLAIATDGVNNTILVRDDEKSAFRKLLTTDFRVEVSPEFYTFDDKNVYAISNRGRDKAAIVILDLKTGKEQLIYGRNDVDIDSLTYSKKNHKLWDALYTDWRLQRHFFDPELKSIFMDLKKQLPNMEVGITHYDKSEQHFIISAGSDVNPGSYYLYDAKNKKLSKLADSAPWINPQQMSPMKPIEFTSRDGLKIHGYLTIPKGRAAKNLPVVVNPHGGPWARDTFGFNSEVQFLASRGYAVLQVNFRGSTGYGRRFWEASFKQWGGTMQNDLSDGVIWLIRQGIADPKRIAIYGSSYGGYATLAGLAFSPELYACGVDYVGVSNLFTFMKTVPPYWKPYLQMMQAEVGDPEKDQVLLKAASPVFHVDKIKAPLFVAQGAKDPRVNINESNQIVNALRARGITVEYMVKDNEGHGFHNEENRMEFYSALEKFLKEHL